MSELVVVTASKESVHIATGVAAFFEGQGARTTVHTLDVAEKDHLRGYSVDARTRHLSEVRGSLRRNDTIGLMVVNRILNPKADTLDSLPAWRTAMEVHMAELAMAFAFEVPGFLGNVAHTGQMPGPRDTSEETIIGVASTFSVLVTAEMSSSSPEVEHLVPNLKHIIDAMRARRRNS